MPLEVTATDFNLSPQGDGNSNSRALPGILYAFQLIPARGRKRFDYAHQRRDRRHFNLSPQGDGNSTSFPCPRPAPVFQLIPARGRKPFKGILNYSSSIISTYPRKGTETRMVFMNFSELIFQLIPARGRKPALRNLDSSNF